MKTTRTVLLTVLLACGCSGANTEHQPPQKPAGGKGDQISPSDDPNRLIDGASFKLSDNISAADVGQTFGTDDAHIPYPDTYWPMTQDGIDANWSGTTSPLAKYMSIANPSHYDEAKMWEHLNHGAGVPGVQGWYGHCPGWTAAAMTNAPLLHAVWAKSDGQGGIVGCADGDAACTKFEIGDVNALMAEVYVDADSRFIGGRCDTKPSDIKRDQYGRIVRNGSGCQGLNAGAVLVVAGNLMKKRGKAFAIDAQNDFNTDQIWNQPAYRYQVYRFQTLTEAQAANWVGHGSPVGDLTKYMWNDAAHGWVLVDFGIKWVSERGPNTTPVSGADSTRETHMVAVVELDGDPAAGDPSIIGGEYVDDSSVGADRLTVPPFVWVALGPGPEDLGTWVGGNNHNPYLKPSLVKQLIAMGQGQSGGGGSGGSGGSGGTGGTGGSGGTGGTGGTTCDYRCADYGYSPGDCYQGWSCADGTCLTYVGTCP